MAQLADVCYAVPLETLQQRRISLVYLILIGISASYWDYLCRRVFEEFDFTSRVHRPTKPEHVNGRFALIPWSFVCLLFSIRSLAAHYVETGKGSHVIFANYIGMSDAILALLRIVAHGTCSGNRAIWELFFRKTPTVVFLPEGMPAPIVLLRVINFVPSPTSSFTGQFSPAAALEAHCGACTLAVHPLTLSFCTTPHGDSGLLFHEHIRAGRKPVPPIALDYLNETVLRLGPGMMTFDISAESNALMLSQLRVVEAVVAQLPTSERGACLSNGKITLATAWTWLVGSRAVMCAIKNVQPPSVPVLHVVLPLVQSQSLTLLHGVLPSPALSESAESTTCSPGEMSGKTISESVTVQAALPLQSNSAVAFAARSHLSLSMMEQLVSLDLVGTALSSTLRLVNVPRRITPGAPDVTKEDIQNAQDADARRGRGGSTVSEHLTTILLGPLAAFGWAHTEVSFNNQVCFYSFSCYSRALHITCRFFQGEPVTLRSVIVSPLQREYFASHSRFYWVRVMDGTFGVGMQGLDFFAIMFIHPETQIALPFAFFIRKRGSKESPHPLLPDLVWMEKVLERQFGFPVPRYTMVDKCMSSLTAQAECVKSAWASLRDIAATQRVPSLPAADTEASTEDATRAFLATRSELEHIAVNCSQTERAAFARYLADVVSTRGTSLPVPSAEGVLPSSEIHAAACAVFGQWAIAHPSLTRALAACILDELSSVKLAVAVAPVRAGAIDAVLSKLQSFACYIADNNSLVSSFFRSHVERWIRLCFFHAKKSLREWGEHSFNIMCQYFKLFAYFHVVSCSFQRRRDTGKGVY